MMIWKASMELTLGSLDLQVTLEGGREPIAVVGTNGSGKTTLLRALAGAFTPRQGRFELNGEVLFDSSEQVDLAPEKRGVGYVPQGYGLFPHLRAVDNISFGLSSDLGSQERRERALESLREMKCLDLAERWPKTLSGVSSNALLWPVR